MLMTRSVRPSQIGPMALSLRASAQSSISASRIASMPPASVSLSARISAQPPAAAAIAAVDPGERVEHLEEEHEGRDQAALREALAAQLDHEGGEHGPARGRIGH